MQAKQAFPTEVYLMVGGMNFLNLLLMENKNRLSFINPFIYQSTVENCKKGR